METTGTDPRADGPEMGASPAGAADAFPPAEQRLLVLMGEFRRRQRERPDLVVRPWLSHGAGEAGEPAVGFVVEYCPRGDACAELRVRHDGALAEGPGGSRRAALSLGAGWVFEGADVRGPELLANHLLRLAGSTLPGDPGRASTSSF